MDSAIGEIGKKTMRLIDADALTLDLFKKAMDDALLNGNSDMHMLLTQVIAHYPTIDAVPVIRCRDCVWNREKEWVDCYMSGMHGRNINNFCSRGERKDDETD